MTDESRNIFRVAGSVLLGFLGAITTFFVLIFLSIALGFFGWSDGGDPEYLRRLEKTTNITFVISTIIAIIVFKAIIKKANRKSYG